MTQAPWNWCKNVEISRCPRLAPLQHGQFDKQENWPLSRWNNKVNRGPTHTTLTVTWSTLDAPPVLVLKRQREPPVASSWPPPSWWPLLHGFGSQGEFWQMLNIHSLFCFYYALDYINELWIIINTENSWRNCKLPPGKWF